MRLAILLLSMLNDFYNLRPCNSRFLIYILSILKSIFYILIADIALLEASFKWFINALFALFLSLFRIE